MLFILAFLLFVVAIVSGRRRAFFAFLGGISFFAGISILIVSWVLQVMASYLPPLVGLGQILVSVVTAPVGGPLWAHVIVALVTGIVAIYLGGTDTSVEVDGLPTLSEDGPDYDELQNVDVGVDVNTIVSKNPVGNASDDNSGDTDVPKDDVSDADSVVDSSDANDQPSPQADGVLSNREQVKDELEEIRRELIDIEECDKDDPVEAYTELVMIGGRIEAVQDDRLSAALKDDLRKIERQHGELMRVVEDSVELPDVLVTDLNAIQSAFDRVRQLLDDGEVSEARTKLKGLDSRIDQTASADGLVPPQEKQLEENIAELRQQQERLSEEIEAAFSVQSRIQEHVEAGDQLRAEARQYADSTAYKRSRETYRDAAEAYRDALDAAEASPYFEGEEIKERIEVVTSERMNLQQRETEHDLRNELEELRETPNRITERITEGAFQQAEMLLEEVQPRFASLQEKALEADLNEVQEEIAVLKDQCEMALTREHVLQHLREMDEYEFEDLVATVWESRGWETTVTQDTGDRGIDVVAEKEEPFYQKQLLQAKRYAAGNTIGSDEVRTYSTLLHQEDQVDVVVIVTTSSFTAPAKRLADDLNVKLIDGSTFYELLMET